MRASSTNQRTQDYKEGFTLFQKKKYKFIFHLIFKLLNLEGEKPRCSIWAHWDHWKVKGILGELFNFNAFFVYVKNIIFLNLKGKNI